MSKETTLHGLSFLEDRIVVVGKAEPIKDHGEPCWLCLTQPPYKPKHEVVRTRIEAFTWLQTEAQAEEIWEGTIL